MVDAAGRPLAVIPGEFTGGEIEIARGDLARLLHDPHVGDVRVPLPTAAAPGGSRN